MNKIIAIATSALLLAAPAAARAANSVHPALAPGVFVPTAELRKFASAALNIFVMEYADASGTVRTRTVEPWKSTRYNSVTDHVFNSIRVVSPGLVACPKAKALVAGEMVDCANGSIAGQRLTVDRASLILCRAPVADIDAPVKRGSCNFLNPDTGAGSLDADMLISGTAAIGRAADGTLARPEMAGAEGLANNLEKPRGIWAVH